MGVNNQPLFSYLYGNDALRKKRSVLLQNMDRIHLETQYRSLQIYFQQRFHTVSLSKFETEFRAKIYQEYLGRWKSNFPFFRSHSSYRILLVGLHAVFVLQENLLNKNQILRLNHLSFVDLFEFRRYNGLRVPKQILQQKLIRIGLSTFAPITNKPSLSPTTSSPGISDNFTPSNSPSLSIRFPHNPTAKYKTYFPSKSPFSTSQIGLYPSNSPTISQGSVKSTSPSPTNFPSPPVSSEPTLSQSSHPSSSPVKSTES